MNFTKWTASLVLALMAIGFASSSFANGPGSRQTTFQELDSNDPILNDIYVRLYLARLSKAKFVVASQNQELGNLTKHRDRLETLFVKKNVSAQEVDDSRKAVEVAYLRMQEALAAQKEAETFVDIAISRISVGLEMPICAEMR